MFYAGLMSEFDSSGPDPDAITRHILATFPETDLVAIKGAAFFSLDPERHFPNFATIVWADDDYDQFSNLSRPGVFRLNIGVNRPTFERLVGSGTEPDYTALDRIFPHPVYAKQLYISILNPSAATWRDVVVPLLAEAHDRLAAQRARTAAGRSARG